MGGGGGKWSCERRHSVKKIVERFLERGADGQTLGVISARMMTPALTRFIVTPHAGTVHTQLSQAALATFWPPMIYRS